MKLKYFIVLMFFYPLAFHTQVISVGFRTHQFSSKELSDVLGYYNESRPWLDQQFSTSGGMYGFEFGLSGSKEKYGYSLMKLYNVSKKTSAKGSNNGQFFDRKIIARNVGVEIIDAWWTPIHMGRIRAGGGLMPIGLGFFRIKTKLNGETTKVALTDFYSGPMSSSHIYSNFHLDFTRLNEKGGGLHVQLFRTIGPTQEYDLIYLNRTINPLSYSSFNKRTLLKMNDWGFKLNWSF